MPTMNMISGMVVNRTLIGTSYNPREPINHINVATIIILGTIIPQPDLNAINRKITTNTPLKIIENKILIFDFIIFSLMSYNIINNK